MAFVQIEDYQSQAELVLSLLYSKKIEQWLNDYDVLL